MKFYLGTIKVAVVQNEKLFLRLSALTIGKPPDSLSEVTKGTSSSLTKKDAVTKWGYVGLMKVWLFIARFSGFPVIALQGGAI